MGNLFSVCLPRTVGPGGGSPQDAEDERESASALLRGNRSIATGDSPRTTVLTRVRESWISANAVMTAQMSRRGAHGARHRTAQQALSHVSNFYQMQLFRKLNVHCVSESQEEDVTDHGHADVLDRKVSFLSIAPLLEDIDALTGASQDETLPRMDINSQAVLEEVLTAILLNYRIVEADAVTAARRGERGMPLTLDHARFGDFLAEKEALLTSVIQACEQEASRPECLKPLLQRLATDYFVAAGRLPNGLASAMHRTFDGHCMTNEPVTVLVGDFDESKGHYLADTSNDDEKVVVTVGAPILAGSPSLYKTMRKGFEAHSPAEQRAIVVLQTLFCGITSAEEGIIGSGLQCRTDNEYIQSRGTSAHIHYTGSVHLGDACEHSDEGSHQRQHASAPLQRLPQLLQEHEAAHQTALLADPALKRWIEDPAFDLSVLSINHPALRLPLAQIATTGKLLLQSRAFGGKGIAQR